MSVQKGQNRFNCLSKVKVPYLTFLDYDIYRIAAVLKVEIDIIASITASPMGWAVIMYLKIFKSGVIVFISDTVTLTDNFQYQSQFLRM
jgi:hypothetical protein